MEWIMFYVFLWLKVGGVIKGTNCLLYNLNKVIKMYWMKNDTNLGKYLGKYVEINNRIIL